MEKRVLALIGEVIGLLDLDELSHGLLRALRQAVPSSWCALNEVPPIRQTRSRLPTRRFPMRCTTCSPVTDENPIADYFLRTGDGRATRFST